MRGFVSVLAIWTAVIIAGALAQTTVATTKRVYNVQLTYNATAKAWTIPTAASNLAIFVNGLRYFPGDDYTLAPGLVKAYRDNMPATARVVADYDKPQ